MVVQHQPHETKGSIKINVSDEKEKMHLFPLLFQGAQDWKGESAFSKPGRHRKATHMLLPEAWEQAGPESFVPNCVRLVI